MSESISRRNSTPPEHIERELAIATALKGHGICIWHFKQRICRIASITKFTGLPRGGVLVQLLPKQLDVKAKIFTDQASRW